MMTESSSCAGKEASIRSCGLSAASLIADKIQIILREGRDIEMLSCRREGECCIERKMKRGGYCAYM